MLSASINYSITQTCITTIETTTMALHDGVQHWPSLLADHTVHIAPKLLLPAATCVMCARWRETDNCQGYKLHTHMQMNQCCTCHVYRACRPCDTLPGLPYPPPSPCQAHATQSGRCATPRNPLMPIHAAPHAQMVPPDVL